MAGLFDKLRTTVLAAAHGLIDKSIDLNSIEVVRQHVRDLETAIGEGKGSYAAAVGYVRSLEREVAELETRISTTNNNIDLLLNDGDPSNDESAVKLEEDLVGLEETMAVKREELQSARQTAGEFAEVLDAMKARHRDMLQRVQQLAALERQAKTKTQAAAAITRASRAMGGGVDASVDDVEARIRRRADEADVLLEQANASMTDTPEQDVRRAHALARIQARRNRMAVEAEAPS